VESEVVIVIYDATILIQIICVVNHNLSLAGASPQHRALCSVSTVDIKRIRRENDKRASAERRLLKRTDRSVLCVNYVVCKRYSTAFCT